MAKIIFHLSLIFLIFLINSKPLVGNKVVVALNCGSKDQFVEAPDKIFKYEPDQKYVSGQSVDVDYHSNQAAKQNDILYTFEKKLYMYERHTYKEMTYSLPVKKGKNTIVLKFAQMYFTNPGQRVFNIKIGNTIVRKDFDVIALVGQRYAAYQQYIEVQIKSDGLYYDGKLISSGLASNKLKISFAKGKADNPIVQGIIVYADSIENSSQDQYKTLKSTWDKQKQLQKAMKEDEKLKEIIAIQKKKEKISIRNDQLIIENNSDEEKKTGSRQKYGLMRKLLMGPIGVIGFAVAFYAVFYVTKVYVFLLK